MSCFWVVFVFFVFWIIATYPVVLYIIPIAIVWTMISAWVDYKKQPKKFTPETPPVNKIVSPVSPSRLNRLKVEESSCEEKSESTIQRRTPPVFYSSKTSRREVTVFASPSTPIIKPIIQGGVYLIKSGTYYKIGKADVFDRRIKQIKLQLPEKVEVVHKVYTKNALEVEKQWHQRFKNKRKNGEWFELSDADVAEFKKH